jgi:mRNA-degrading endonuclease YafQ of YafQ-DinJ toxin-antitoxin module
MLKTYKLTGEFSRLYAFSINYQLRVVFELLDTGDVVFIRMGTHEIYV